MVNIHPLLFLFLIQFLIVFAVLSAFLIDRYRKLCIRRELSEGEVSRLKTELETAEQDAAELAKWKEKFLALEVKFDQIRAINVKLKESIEQLIPEAERSKEYEQLMAEIEQNNRELDSCIGTLKQENINLGKESHSLKDHIEKLTQQLSQSVSKDKYNILHSQKKSLELKIDKLKKDLEEEHSSHETLKKNYAWLEKEYNALYNNIQETSPGEEPGQAAPS